MPQIEFEPSGKVKKPNGGTANELTATQALEH
jgi:hypothetical protein